MPEEGQIDQLLTNVQARRRMAQTAKAHGLNPKVTTERRPSREDNEIPRSPTTRLIRGSLAATMKDIKNDPQMRVGLLSEFVGASREMAEDLDKLDYQFHTNGRIVEAGKGSGERESIYLAELDLREPSNEPDTRIPWVMIGGASSISEQNAALSMALALQGERVFVLTLPDQMKEQTGGRSLREKIANSYNEDFNAFRRVIEDLGVSKVNLIGHSLGGGLVLELAGDQELSQKVQVEDVLALDPTGFERRRIFPMAIAFKNTAKDVEKDPEAKTIMLEQGNIDAHRASGIGQENGILKPLKEGLSFLSSGRASASKRFSPEKLAEISGHVSGDVEIWTGESNRVVKPEAIIECVNNAGDVPNLSLYVIKGGKHEAIIANALGFIATHMDEKRSRAELGDLYRSKNIKISISTLERSGAEYLLKQMQPKSK